MNVARRAVYRHGDLARVFAPKSVAVFGASGSPASFGARTIANLATYEGRVYRVNPRYSTLGGEPCFPSAGALPEVPDCAILSLPREATEAAVLECAKAGVGGVVLFASGYVETGVPERAADQARLTAIARDTGLKILGPNCIGFLNFGCRGMFSFSSAGSKMARPVRPAIGLVSQSGAVGFALAQADLRGMAFSHVLTFGNGADVGIADQIAYLAEEPSCAAIACLFEGTADPRQLLEAGEIARAAGKPVVLHKLGQGDEAATAALSHTGSLAGSAAGYEALFERAGFVVVPFLERLLETASFFAKAPRRPRSRGVAAISTSGGALIAATDAGERAGVPMPQPPEDMKARLRPCVPEFGALRNPCDLTAMGVSNAGVLPAAVEAMLTGDTYGAMVLPQTSLSEGVIARRAAAGPIGAKLGKPVCLALVGGWVGGLGIVEAEVDPDFYWFYSLESCYGALAAWHRLDDRRAADAKVPPRARLSDPASKAKAAALIVRSARGTLTEREAKEVLACYGLPVVAEALARSRDEAAAAACSLGFPVALKVESPDLPHKTEAGVIRLNLGSDDAVRTAYDEVTANAARVTPAPRVNGVLVQPMVRSGAELMIGGKVDPLFGPTIVAGLGGVFVELLKDTALELAPVTALEARALIGRLKGQPVLDGFRGAPAVDRARFAEIVARVSEFLDDQQDLVAEFDVNPLIAAGDRIVAVDALIVRR